MPLPLIYNKCVVRYSLILLYLSNESQSTLKFTQCQINAGFLWTLVLVRGHLYVCLWYFEKNTKIKFHTCYVVVLELRVCYVHKGLAESRGSHKGFIIYLFHIYLYPALEVLNYEFFSPLAFHL